MCITILKAITQILHGVNPSNIGIYQKINSKINIIE